VPRSVVIFLLVVAGIAVFGFWGLPFIKERLFTDSLQTMVNVLGVPEENFDVEFKGQSVSRTIVDMEIIFPMGRAPENVNELQVVNELGELVEVNWTRPETREDIPEKGVTRWVIKPVFFPIGFRKGTLKNKYSDLCVIQLPAVKPATP